MNKRRRYAKAAAKCHSGRLRAALTAKTSKVERSRHYCRTLGKFGPASEVVRIDPSSYEGEWPKT